MTHPIRKLHVHENIRQVDAHEAHAPRTLGFAAGVLAAAASIRFWTPPQPQIAAVLYGLCALLFLMLLRPWHRRLNVDLDAMNCRVTWVAFGFVPFRARRIDLTDRRLTVDRRRVVQRTGEGSSGAGCLALALPFPLSLLTLFARSKSDGLVAASTIHFVLCAKAEGRPTADLARVLHPDTAQPFLDAVEELLPN